jgi:ComF family protein
MISFRHLHAGKPSARALTAWRVVAGGLSSVRDALDALVFPWSCPVCGVEASGKPFCGSCRQRLLEQSARASALACPRCALQTGPFSDLRGGCSECRDRSLGFDSALALGPYDGDLRDLCLRLKHEQNAWLAPWLGELFVEARGTVVSRLPHDTWIVPVPLHWWRRWCRGYNQAEALARGLARRLNLPVRQPLRRVTATERLAHKGRTERAGIMHGVFHSRPSRQLDGRTILLVDDILTTGVTCGDAARALKKAGAKQVIVAVMARAERQAL